MREPNILLALSTAFLFLPLLSLASLSWLTPLAALAAPLPGPRIPGKYVRFSDLDECPDLAPHEPKNSRDVRLDNIGIVMALGDSITAGFLATPPTESDWLGDQRVLGGLGASSSAGLSFPISLQAVDMTYLIQQKKKPARQPRTLN